MASVAAAQAVARAHGVPCDDAVRIAAGSNALVHLKPSPVVARVMTGTAVLHDDVERWLEREVAVGVFLAQSELIVPPTDLLPPGPHEHGGLWMTMWRFVEHDDRAPDPAELGRSLRDLHTALARFSGDLAPLGEIRDWLADLTDDDALLAELDALTPTVFESSLPTQALHGDVSIGNLLRTDRGLLWNDLEDVCVGPVEWDVAGLVASARMRGHDEIFIEELLTAYGPRDVEALAPFLQAHELYTTIWRAYAR